MGVVQVSSQYYPEGVQYVTQRRIEFYTLCFAALTESPGAPVMVLPADPNRKTARFSITGVAAIGESAAAVTAAALTTQGVVLVPGTVNGGLNANVSYETHTTSAIWMLGYTGGAAGTVRIFVERYA